ncbi:hypothetical protein WR25_17031 [Diploscapter pachys]|uniref:Uncharacterized protein n=1 Tax=Diploscapter pachys TaxID=2018661 RepID=A0A2A2KZG4_9BILA|nr:hypothetical protein WR25_17031 [Diploscapter pachys]
MTEAKKRKLDDSWLEDEVVFVTGGMTSQIEPKLGNAGDAQIPKGNDRPTSSAASGAKKRKEEDDGHDSFDDEPTVIITQKMPQPSKNCELPCVAATRPSPRRAFNSPLSRKQPQSRLSAEVSNGELIMLKTQLANLKREKERQAQHFMKQIEEKDKLLRDNEGKITRLTSVIETENKFVVLFYFRIEFEKLGCEYFTSNRQKENSFLEKSTNLKNEGKKAQQFADSFHLNTTTTTRKEVAANSSFLPRPKYVSQDLYADYMLLLLARAGSTPEAEKLWKMSDAPIEDCIGAFMNGTIKEEGAKKEQKKSMIAVRRSDSTRSNDGTNRSNDVFSHL